MGKQNFSHRGTETREEDHEVLAFLCDLCASVRNAFSVFPLRLCGFAGYSIFPAIEKEAL
jgi:hypothetical protein